MKVKAAARLAMFFLGLLAATTASVWAAGFNFDHRGFEAGLIVGIPCLVTFAFGPLVIHEFK